jgi:hypothetical protein
MGYFTIGVLRLPGPAWTCLDLPGPAGRTSIVQHIQVQHIQVQHIQVQHKQKTATWNANELTTLPRLNTCPHTHMRAHREAIIESHREKMSPI